jgi:hypothetical protein
MRVERLLGKAGQADEGFFSDHFNSPQSKSMPIEVGTDPLQFFQAPRSLPRRKRGSK